jgi:sugar/nucleoside kinase (ribokinase family)
MKKYVAYGIGAALVDTEIKVQDRELAQINVEKGLMTLVDEERQRELLGHLEGHLVKANHASGGSAGNSMIATAQFGGPTFMSCKVANDADGDIYIADLEAAGVDHCFKTERAEGTTGKCLVLITPDAERSMNTFLGISETLSTEQLDAEAISASEYVYIEGYLVTSPTGRAAAVKARELAEAAGVKTALSFSDPGMVEFFRDGMVEIVGERLDLIFCNEAEALGWAETDSLEEAIEKLKQVAGSFVITLGSRGALTFDVNWLRSRPTRFRRWTATARAICSPGLSCTRSPAARISPPPGVLPAWRRAGSWPITGRGCRRRIIRPSARSFLGINYRGVGVFSG